MLGRGSCLVSPHHWQREERVSTLLLDGGGGEDEMDGEAGMRFEAGAGTRKLTGMGGGGEVWICILMPTSFQCHHPVENQEILDV
jgi:hypothetical protein